MGIDFGMKRLGLAFSDERKIIATPHSSFPTERKSEQTVQKLVEFINEFQIKNNCTIEEVVIGLPLMLSGKTGLLADEVKHFIFLLEKLVSIPVKAWDERLTTVQAERSLRESSLSRKRRTKIVDMVSAAIILQNYLDSKNINSMV